MIHVHEPIAPVVGWDACCLRRARPVVGTFHAYSTELAAEHDRHARSARAGSSTGCTRASRSRRPRGGRASATSAAHYDGDPERRRPRRRAARARSRRATRCGSCSSAARRSARDCRCCCPRSPACAGTSRRASRSSARRPRRSSRCSPRSRAAWTASRCTARVDDEELWRRLHDADVLCAPSLGGESFGMVLTEAFAAGTPVVASDIAGYRQVVTHGRDGLLVPHGRPLELAEALRSLWLDPARRGADGRRPRARGPRTSRGRSVAAQVDRRLRARDRGAGAGRRRASAVARQGRPRAAATCRRAGRARRLPSLEPRRLPGSARAARACSPARAAPRSALSAVLGLLLAFLALRRVGFENVVHDARALEPELGADRARAVLDLDDPARGLLVPDRRAALPDRPVKRRTILSGTVIGVLMSATLPARLGEPSRALIVARRLGRMRETLPVLVGTLVSQTLLNLLALLLLGVVVLGTSDVLRGHEGALVLVSLMPVGLAAAVLIVPVAAVERPPGRLAAAGRARAAGARGGRGAAAAAQGTDGLPPAAPRGLGDRAPSSPPGGCSCSARSRCCSRSASTPRRHRRRRGRAVRGERDRGAAGDAVERRRLPARGDHRADRARTACPPRPRSATGSSCRRSRS